MVKRIIPPHAYTGPRPDGFKFQRFEEYASEGKVSHVEGMTPDGKRVVIPQQAYWVKE